MRHLCAWASIHRSSQLLLLEDIGRAQVVIERFKQLTQKWLKRVQTAEKKASAHITRLTGKGDE